MPPSFWLLLSTAVSQPLPDDSYVVSPATVTNGVSVHTVVSTFQPGTTHLRVLLPNQIPPGQRLPVIYLLPVEAGLAKTWGDPLPELQRLGTPDRFPAVYVYPTFAHLPWYGDHATNPLIRQESYFRYAVVPAIKGMYPADPDPANHWLLGFSKSGWGAYSFLLRNPDEFGKAVAWDAPLMLNSFSQSGMSGIYGTIANFRNYQVSNLLPLRAMELNRQSPRLILMGYGGWQTHVAACHQQMVDLGIPHIYQFGPQRTHSWNSGWLEPAIGFLYGQVPEVNEVFAMIRASDKALVITGDDAANQIAIGYKDRRVAVRGIGATKVNGTTSVTWNVTRTLRVEASMGNGADQIGVTGVPFAAGSVLLLGAGNDQLTITQATGTVEIDGGDGFDSATITKSPRLTVVRRSVP